MQEVLLFIIILFSPLIEGGTTYLPVTIIRLLIIAISFIWLWNSLNNKSIIIKRTRLDIAIILFTLLSILSTIFLSPYKNISIQWLMSIVSYALLFYLFIFLVDTDKKTKRIIYAIIFIGAFEAMFGILQYLFGGIGRVKGTFFNPNFLAGYLAAVFSLCAGLLVYEEDRIKKIFYSAILVLSLIAIILTISRGGFLLLLLSSSFIIWRRFGKKTVYFILALVFIVIVIPNPLKERVKALPHADIYAYSRIDIWKSSLSMIKDHPLGAGLGIFKYTSQHYNFQIKEAIAYYGKRAETAHNEYLQIGVELGVLGLLIFFYGILMLAKEINECLKSAETRLDKGLVAGLTGGIIGILSHSAVDANLHELAIVILLIIYCGLIIAIRQTKGRDKTILLRITPKKYHYAIIILFAVLISVYVTKSAAAYYIYAYGAGQNKKGEIERAIRACEWSIFLDSSNAAYNEALAANYFTNFQDIGNINYAERAIIELEYAEYLNPINGRFPNRKALIYNYIANKESNNEIRQKLQEEAIKNYKKAIELDPYTPFNYNEIGSIYFTQGKIDEAIEKFKYVVALEPNFLAARFNLALVYKEKSKIELAKGEFLKILEIKERFKQADLSNPMDRIYLNIDEEVIKKELNALKAIEK